MDYYPNFVTEATPFMERQAPARSDPFGIRSTPFLVEPAHSPSIVDGFLAQGVSSGRPAHLGEPTGVEAGAFAQDQTATSENVLTQLARRRVALIQARNASSRVSVELTERLRILNERMNQQSPRVTEAHIQSIEEAAALGEQVASRRAARMALLSR
jgi:hypothetical protein